MAAIINMETIAYFLILINEIEETKPTLPINVNNTGNWKHMPNANMNLIVRLRYSFIVPRYLMPTRLFKSDVFWKLKKKLKEMEISESFMDNQATTLLKTKKSNNDVDPDLLKASIFEPNVFSLLRTKSTNSENFVLYVIFNFSLNNICSRKTSKVHFSKTLKP